ncbi:S8 family serine peptidase [Corynebacterium sp. sy039]|nr:S8 family serine peptidase [Corynebacterium sp. sy039]
MRAFSRSFFVHSISRITGGNSIMITYRYFYMAHKKITYSLYIFLSFTILTSCLFLPYAPQAFAQEQKCAPTLQASDNDIRQQAQLADSYRAAHRFATGVGIRVAVIDTGVYAHPRLGVVQDGGDFLDGEQKFSALEDCDAHGTIVAGIIAARDHGDAVVGVAPDVELLSLRQTSALIRTHKDDSDESGSGTLDSLTQAIVAAVEQGAHIINISVVSCLPADADPAVTYQLDSALALAEQHNVLIVAAAGNESSACPQGSVALPAHKPNVIRVSSLKDSRTIADYSLRSPLPSLSVLGHVYAGLDIHDGGMSAGIVNGNSLTPFEGTSFAAPIVTGLAALLKQRMPYASNAEIRSLLFDSVDPVSGAVIPERVISMLRSTPVPTHHIRLSTKKDEQKHNEDRLFHSYTLTSCGVLSAIICFSLFLAGLRSKRMNKN